jgi:hypothetical protein
MAIRSQRGAGEPKEPQVSIKSQVKKLIALGLAAGAIVVATGIGIPAGGARPGAPTVNAAVHNQVDPNARLQPAGPSELEKLRRAEAQKRAAFSYRVPASARYSSAELNIFAREGHRRR